MAGKYDHLKREELAEVRLKYNPNVHTEVLKIASVVDTRADEKYIDFRAWVDSYLGKEHFEGPTKRGFRLNREQYIEFRKGLAKVDEFFGITRKESKDE